MEAFLDNALVVIVTVVGMVVGGGIGSALLALAATDEGLTLFGRLLAVVLGAGLVALTALLPFYALVELGVLS